MEQNAAWIQITKCVQEASRDVMSAMGQNTNAERVRRLRMVATQINAIADTIVLGNFQE